MDFQGKDKILFDRWHSLHLQERGTDDTTSPSDKGDVMRRLLTQVEYATVAKIVSPMTACKLLFEQHDNYSQVADVSDEQGGFDNFAEGALALLEGKRNESKHWKTSLTMETATELSCVRKFMQTSKAARACIVPPDKENAPLILKPSKLEENMIPKGLASTAAFNRQPIFKKISPADASAEQAKDFGVNNASNVDFKVPSVPYQEPITLNKAGHPFSGHGIKKMPVKIPGPGSGGFWNIGEGNTRKMGFGNETSSSQGEEQNTTQSAGHWGGRNPNIPCSSNQGWNSHNTSQAWNNNRNTTYPVQGNSDYEGNCWGNVPPYRKPEPMKRPRGNPFGDEDEEAPAPSSFKTAKEQLAIDSQKKYGRGRGAGDRNPSTSAYGTNKKSLGTRRGPSSKFVPPVMAREDCDDGGMLVRKSGPNKAPTVGPDGEVMDERLKSIDPKMIELVMNEVMDHGAPVTWEDIAGLEFAKKTIKEIVVWPMLRPDIFTGLRGPPKGLLLFGPPGTGKTLIGKCIASQSKSTFFSISASSLTSKWVGEGEKMVRALFAVARVNQPAVIFMDEIDSLLSQRSDGENEGSRRIKTEFLVQLDGATTGEEDRILVVGATNRPQEIDEAARRRFVKRLYIPLPESIARRQIVINLMSEQKHGVSDSDLDHVCQNTDGYSGADMANLCREAALGPIRSIAFEDINNITADQVRPICFSDFQDALKQVRASVSDKDLDLYIDWNKQFGSFGV